MDEGVLFRANENAFMQTKRKLLNECNPWCIISLAPGAFINAGAASKTNILFFTKGTPTKEIWYYEVYPPEWRDRQGKIRPGTRFTIKYPITSKHFEEFFKLLPERGESERSWRVSIEEIEAKNYDLKAVNPNRKEEVDERTPEEILNLIETESKEINTIISNLKKKRSVSL